MPATSANETIDVKKATAIAIIHLHGLYPRIPAADVALEEVELSGEHWEITLSFTKPHGKPLKLPEIFGENRIYKKFGINKTTGEVVFMRIRKP